MSLKNIPPCPPSLKQIQHYLKTAAEHDDRDIVIAYWCRLYALQLGLKIDKSSPEGKKLLLYLMDWLEKTKAGQSDNEAICHDIPAQAHLENYALKLFTWADSQDRAANFNKNVVKAFYTAGMIYDVLDTFGDVTEEVQQNKKYAKWKAAYIHNCLKNGETPVPGPMSGEGEDLNEPSSSNALPIGGFRSGGSQGPDSNLDTSGSAGAPFTRTTSQDYNPVIPQDPEQKSSPSTTKANDSFITDRTTITTSSSGVQLSPEQMNKAQKYCKWAASALNYDDVPTAVNNLQKALQLLTTGADE